MLFQFHNFVRLGLIVALMVASQTQPTSQAAANTYYLSPTGNDANPGTQALPWRTLTRLQTALNNDDLNAGDQVLLARDATFTGTLTLDTAVSGATNAPITFGAYGTGATPILRGMDALSGWPALGNNQWRATCNTCTSMPASLLVSGIPQPLTRWPNLDEADEGYRYFTGFSGRNSITDSALPANPNWAGGELVLRPIAWILDRLTIVSHTGNTLVTAEDSSYPIELGWGYFIQNHLAALDRNGEWVYNRNDKTITLQWPTDPNALVVEVPIRNTLIEIRNSQHVRFQDLELRGAQNNLLDVGGCSHLVLERLSMRFAGDRALLLNSCPNSQLTESTISDSMNNGLQLYACANCRVAHTQIERIGLVAGMGRNADGQYVGAETGGTAGNPAIFEHNQQFQI